MLTASLGWHYVATGDVGAAMRCLEWVTEHFDNLGRLAEQYGGERRDLAMHAEWTRRWGPPAADLTWSHAMFVILSDELDHVAIPP